MNELDTALHTKDKGKPDENKVMAEDGLANVRKAEHDLHLDEHHQASSPATLNSSRRHHTRSSATWGDRTLRHKP